jgi:16S rRNA (cytosine967-C5)-methyltransferase
MSSVRAYAAETLFLVIDKGQSLSQVMPKYSDKLPLKERPLFQQLCYGVLRYLPSLENYTAQLLDKPLKGKQRSFQFLIYVGIYQLQHMRIPSHAALDETVNAAKTMRAPGLKGLINAVLRNFQRRQSELEQAAEKIDACKYNHPGWFINKLKAAYPDTWQSILAANQLQAPMWLRINAQYQTPLQYRKLLGEHDVLATTDSDFQDAVLLDQPIDVYKLPGFELGHCSVQDAAAQLAARLLAPQDNEKILDACAAPGGKTCHILEIANCDVTALDQDQTRLTRVSENLERIGLNAQLICADASDPSSWWDGEQYDRILLDVPCSATGVIRRHPDIKWLRRASDIEQLAALQKRILECVWPMLKQGGTLVYATCSVLPEENTLQIQQFLQTHADAKHIQLTPADTLSNLGLQLLPNKHDGFYYAKIEKQ